MTPSEHSVQQILKTVSEVFGVTIARLKSPKKDQETFRARVAAVHLLREHKGLSSSASGRVLGGRDHSSILSALRRADAWLSDRTGEADIFRTKVREVERLLSGVPPKDDDLHEKIQECWSLLRQTRDLLTQIHLSLGAEK